MKQKDYILIGVVILFSAVFSYFISGQFLTPTSKRQQQVEVVGPITSDFPLPSATIFNPQSVNPTKQIQIGGSSNPNPFAQP